MNEAPGDNSNGDAAARVAADELLQVEHKVASARVVLARLLQEVVVAENLLRGSEAAQLLAANEQLILTALRNQSEAETAAAALARATRSADLDGLTELPNRALMLDRLAQALSTAKRHERRLAVLFMDLNNFKQVNDSLGHAMGDEVLKVVAHRLVAAVRDADTVCRYGGDEFVVLLTEINEPADAERIADALILALAAPSRIGEQVMRLTASIGIAIHPDDGDDIQTLLDHADSAMYTAKRQGLGNAAFYSRDGAVPAVSAAHAPPAGVPAPPLVQALHDPVAGHGGALEDQQRRAAELREANEQLVLAVLSAQELQASSERALRRHAEFMATVAEELGNPLAPIRLAAAMLGEVKSAEPLLPRAQAIIEQQVENMARLVASVQEVARAGRAGFQLERQRVELAKVVDAAVAGCRPAMDARLQTFTLRLPETSVMVTGQADRLQQLVRNLLDNASQYTPDLGRIQLVLAVKGDAAELTVSDSGIGITAQALPTIFEPFAQDIAAIGFRSVGVGVGVGIGLSVVRSLVQAHGGTVVAHSAGTGRGSQFVVSLPLAPPRSAQPGAAPDVAR